MLLGNADDIVLHLCGKLGWDLPEAPVPTRHLDVPQPNLKKRPSTEFEREPRRVGNRCVCARPLPVCSAADRGLCSHVWLFEGAEGGRWVEEVERRSLPQHAESRTPSASTSAAATPFDDRQAKKSRTE